MERLSRALTPYHDRRSGLRDSGSSGLVLDAERLGVLRSYRRPSRRSWLPWLLGMAVAAVVLGPALRGGAMLNLDLVITPEVPVPRGVWGLGPDLPRRVPLGVVLAWASSLVGGPRAAVFLFGLCLTVAFVGAWRLAQATPAWCRFGSGLVYALSPFTLTRLGVGHWMLVAAVAVLPWALPHLLRPGDRPGRTLLWAAALGFTGINGGVYVGVLVAVGLIADRGRGAGRILLLVTVAQLPWLVPGSIVLAYGAPDLPDPGPFATAVAGPAGPLRLVVGGGFWRPPNQLGAAGGVGAVVLGAGLLALALLGWRRWPTDWRGRAAGVAGVGFAVALASAVPALTPSYRLVTQTPLGAALRDGQRMLALFLVVLAPAVAAGMTHLAAGVRRSLAPAVHALLAVVALALAGPALWGLGGAVAPVSFPHGWAAAREVVRASPGTVVALPWHEYLDVGFAGGRRVFNPTPDYFGGDVVFSSDPELGRPSTEQTDPRERHVDEVARQIRLGRPQSSALARLGVRWVVLLHEVDWRRYQSLSADGGLMAEVRAPTIELYRVADWPGAVVDADGAAVDHRSPVAPVAWLTAPAYSGPLTWNRPAAPGWLRGLRPVGTTAAGTLGIPRGGGPIWYWPAALTLVADGVTLTAVVLARRRLRRSSEGPPIGGPWPERPCSLRNPR